MRSRFLARLCSTSFLLLGCDGHPQPLSGHDVVDAQAASAPSTGAENEEFEQKVGKVRSLVSGWDNGTAIVARFLKRSGSDTLRLTLIYVDTTPPEWKEQISKWLVLSKALGEGSRVLSTMSLGLPALQSGHWEGGPGRSEVAIMAVLGPQDYQTAGGNVASSLNSGGWCRLELKSGLRAGHLEGTFEGKLMTNDGTGYYTIERGYVYVNR